MEARPLFQCCRWPSSFHASKRGQFSRNFATVMLLAAASISGCKKSPPPVTDPAKMPWLDPQSQIKGLKDDDYRIRGLSAFNLGNMGAKATDAISELKRLAKDDPEPKVRERAKEAIDKIRSAAGASPPQ